jgi:hypothetical protein
MARDKEISQYDLGLVLKDVHDFDGQFLRVSDTKSVVSEYYSHFRVEYNANNQPIVVEYFLGTKPHTTIVQFVNDVSGSLNNKYFTIYSSPDNQKYHVWFNVDSTGIDPAPIDSIGIQIFISANDTAEVISYAVNYVLNNFYKNLFESLRKNENKSVEIKTKGFAVINNSSDFNTNFTISNIPGDEKLIKRVEIEYSGADPIYLGQTLKNYYYNIFKGIFEKNTNLDTAVIWDEIQTTFPSTTSELYSYKLNGILVQTTLVNYQDSTKRIISSVEKTRV